MRKIVDRLKNFKSKKQSWGQCILEYAIIVAVVSAAFLAMALYVRRAVQGRALEIGDKVSPRITGAPGSSRNCGGWGC